MKTAGIFLSISFLFLASLTSVHAGDNKYVEDFLNVDNRDMTSTTAWWDTSTGELKMYPYDPVLVSTFYGAGNPRDIIVDGNHAFVSRGGTFLILSVINPRSIGYRSSIGTGGTVMAADVAGDLAFVASAANGLQLVDISNPYSPVLSGNCDTPGYARDVVVEGNYAYVADNTHGLRVIDISDSANPVEVGFYNTPGLAYRVDVSGNYAFVADVDDYYVGGLQIIDISDPGNPTLSDSYDTPGDAYCVTVSGDYAYVADWDHGVSVFDITDPTGISFAGGCNPGQVRNIDIAGDLAYAVGNSGTYIIDITDPSSPAVLDTISSGNTWGIDAVGEYAFIATYSGGVRSYQIGNVRTPAYVGGCGIDGDRTMIFSGNYLWNTSNGVLHSYDISDPTSPVQAGTYDLFSDFATDFCIAGNYLYAVALSHGLEVIDISDPAFPVHTATYDTPGSAYSIAVEGDYAYVTDYDSLMVIDISDPTVPVRAGASSITSGSIMRNIAIDGDYAFVSRWNNGICVVDISDPANPDSVAEYTGIYNAFHMVIEHNYLYVATGPDMLVFFIRDPLNPILMDQFEEGLYEFDRIAIEGDFAFIADHDFGMHVVKIQTPSYPYIVFDYELSGPMDYAYGVGVNGDYAYITGHDTGIDVIKVFDRQIADEEAVGQSTFFKTDTDEMVAVRFSAAQTDSIYWAVSGDTGASWQDVDLNTWVSLASPAYSLMWQSLHLPHVHNVNPACSQLEIEWLYNFAMIDSIVDVPGDQGGWAYLHFTKSGRDLVPETAYPVAAYNVHRRVDDQTLQSRILAGAEAGCETDAVSAEVAGPKYISMDGERYLVSNAAAGDAPQGVWVVVQTVMAQQDDNYACIVPTVADSSSDFNHSVYFISAHTTTPSVYYHSYPDSGYSVDNIAPGVPTGLAVAYNTGGGNQLSWDPSPEDDFQYFKVYRSDDPEFTPGSATFVYATAEIEWTDPDFDGSSVCYRITALDDAGNESGPASAGIVTGTEDPSLPSAFALGQNVPNPFNPSTTVYYDVPEGGGEVVLRIFDVSGRLVRTLVEGCQTAGAKSVIWNGTNDRGQSVSSGIYFYRMTAPGFTRTRKMVMLR